MGTESDWSHRNFMNMLTRMPGTIMGDHARDRDRMLSGSTAAPKVGKRSRVRKRDGSTGKERGKSDPTMFWMVIGVAGVFLWTAGSGASFGVALALSLLGGLAMALFYRWILALGFIALVLYLISLG